MLIMKIYIHRSAFPWIKIRDNFQAVLLSNALQKSTDLQRYQLHAPLSVNRLYLGDLLVTAYSKFSRNRLFVWWVKDTRKTYRWRWMIGLVIMPPSAFTRSTRNTVDMPIIDTVYEILYNRASPLLKIRELTEKLK